MHFKTKSVFIVLLTIMFMISCGGTGTSTGTGSGGPVEVKILHAGSLSIPFKEIAAAFMEKYPKYKVLLEGHGSRTCARQITDLKRQVDVMGSADSAVIRNLLMPEYADYCIDFTTNEMVIMYTEKSKFADTINSGNWYEILLKPGVQYGHSDPNADPCGYRSILTWQLAEKHYKVEHLYTKLSEAMPKKNIRPKETDLIALLEAGELDYIFIYRSVAQQHHAKYLILPDEINLKSAGLKDFYKTAMVEITGKTPGEKLEKRGAPMVYGVTIPVNAPNREGGIRFLEFLLGKEGRAIMKKNGQPQILPPQVDNKDKLPEELKKFFQRYKLNEI